MRWTDSAIYDLKNYSSYKRSIANLEERIGMLNEKMHSVRSANFAPTPSNHGAGERHFDDTWVNCIVEKENIKLGLSVERKKVALIERGLKPLTDEQRYILTMFYIARPRNYVETICEKLHVEKTTVYKMKDAALRQFTIEEYGIDI